MEPMDNAGRGHKSGDEDRQTTDCLFLRDAYLRTCHAEVLEVSGNDVRLDRTVFYPTGGGQPHDTGLLGGAPVTNVRWGPGGVWHTVEGRRFDVGERVTGQLDWGRRHRLMRTHTALHVLSGVIWNQWGVPVTGGTMEPLTARMDFEFDPLPPNFKEDVEALVNQEVNARRPVNVIFLDRPAALADPALIRTKANLIPSSVTTIRVVDIEGLDKQADGGLHVQRTDEVGHVRVVKTESKGKQNKRVRIEILDGEAGTTVASGVGQHGATASPPTAPPLFGEPSGGDRRGSRTSSPPCGPSHGLEVLPATGPRTLLCPDRF